MFFMSFFWILIIVGVVILIKFVAFPKSDSKPGMQALPDAMAILNDRYARGEIDREEFEAKKRDISG